MTKSRITNNDEWCLRVWAKYWRFTRKQHKMQHCSVCTMRRCILCNYIMQITLQKFCAVRNYSHHARVPMIYTFIFAIPAKSRQEDWRETKLRISLTVIQIFFSFPLTLTFRASTPWIHSSDLNQAVTELLQRQNDSICKKSQRYASPGREEILNKQTT